MVWRSLQANVVIDIEKLRNQPVSFTYGTFDTPTHHNEKGDFAPIICNNEFGRIMKRQIWIFLVVYRLLEMQHLVADLASSRDKLCVEIATPGYVGTTNEVSLNCNAPGFDTAVILLQHTYPDVTFYHRYIVDQNGNSCDGLPDHATDMLAFWFYRQRRKECLPVIITVGTWSSFSKKLSSQRLCYDKHSLCKKITS